MRDRGQGLRHRVLGLFDQRGQGRHLSAEDMHKLLEGGEETIGLASIYQTLRWLNARGLLKEFKRADGEKTYGRFECAPEKPA